MKAFAVAVVALLAVQSVSAGWGKEDKKEEKVKYASKGGDSYGASSGGDSYGSAGTAPTIAYTEQTVTRVKREVVVTKPDPKPVEVATYCTPKPVVVTEAVSYACPQGAEAAGSGDSISCSITTCVTPAPTYVTVQTEAAPAPVADSYSGGGAVVVVAAGGDSYGSSGKDDKSDKKGKKYYGKYGKAKYYKEESKKSSGGDSYGASSGGDSYGATATKTEVVAVPSKPVCTTRKVAAVATCAKGKLSGSVCVVSVERAGCPAGSTAEGGRCKTTKTVLVEQAPVATVVETPVTETVKVPVVIPGTAAVAADSYGASSGGDGYGKVSKKGGKGDKKGYYGKYKSKSGKTKYVKYEKKGDAYEGATISADSYGSSGAESAYCADAPATKPAVAVVAVAKAETNSTA